MIETIWTIAVIWLMANLMVLAAQRDDCNKVRSLVKYTHSRTSTIVLLLSVSLAGLLVSLFLATVLSRCLVSIYPFSGYFADYEALWFTLSVVLLVALTFAFVAVSFKWQISRLTRNSVETSW